MADSKLNAIDRIVSWFSPEAGMRRWHARSVLAYYEAAKPDRTRKGRRATGSANEEVMRAGASLRQIGRHLEQNYDLARGVLNALVTNTVGASGIGVEPQPRNLDGSINDKLARQLMELHKEWKKRPEVTRQHDWPSAERLLARSWFRDGEVFLQQLMGSVPGLEHATGVPFSVEMLEADYVPQQYNSSGSPRIVQGVEVNTWGQPVAYHVFKEDPLETLSVIGMQTKRVSAERMLQLKAIDRIRQVRGVSVFASTLTRFDDLKDYEESERIAAKIAASMAAFIRKGTPDLYNPIEKDEPRQLKMRPGMIFDDLRPGEEIGMIDTKRPNPNLESYRSGQLRAIAAGTGPTYSTVSRRYEGTYSAQRQELVEGFSAYAVLSAEFISQISRPVYERFVALAVASGRIQIPLNVRLETLADATFMPPSMPWIDPLREVEAWGILEDRSYLSGPEIIRKRGGNPMDVLEQQGRWMREKAAEKVPHFVGSGLKIPDPSAGSEESGQ